MCRDVPIAPEKAPRTSPFELSTAADQPGCPLASVRT